jgi:hypothetical protein
MTTNVTILGDSRAFDTYFTNSHYTTRYGYEKTFCHIWRKLALLDPSCDYDAIHIPDHFRGGTVQNNIVRLALTNPAVVVILDGIWDTLISRRHFVEYVERQQQNDLTASGLILEKDYSPELLARLYVAGELSISPNNFAERSRHIISYFRRRQRHVIWMTLPVPPKSYLGSNYHAGDYHPNADWDECLIAANKAVIPIVEAYGGVVLDMTVEMERIGGAEQAFIDQWHFTPEFHAQIAEALHRRASRLVPTAPDARHVSHNYMLGSPNGPESRDVICYDGEPADELDTLLSLGPEQIMVYPSELGPIDNPTGNDRAEFEKQSTS